MAKTQYVKCGLASGFFDEEVYVLVGSSSAIVSRNAVRIIDEPKLNVQGQGEVCVYVVEQTPDRLLVELPGQAVVGGLRTWVPLTDLSAA
jgi:hypothetical protein